ncbi:hypothetical protein PVAND_000479 [Polypedilum vanderplanki]|uniref:RING-type domain-containing protein n=1 Tax=Polypedilum vanderplanki TaxID=319348 RepID=A0A9J6BJY4_POLVA|nr:hypothetical protein PVAND_000479 [Polypedilum vanderplanki]
MFQCMKCLNFVSKNEINSINCGHLYCPKCFKHLFNFDYFGRIKNQKAFCWKCTAIIAKENQIKSQIANIEKKLENQNEINADLTKNLSKIESVLDQIAESKKDQPKENANPKICIVYENQTTPQLSSQLVSELDSLVKNIKSSLNLN